MPNRLKNISIWCLILTFLLLYTNSQVSAQGKRKKKLTVKKVEKSICKVNNITFKCPDGFSKPEKLDENAILLKRSYEGSITYLTVLAPNSNSEEGLTENLAKQIIAKLLPNDSQNFVWKNIDSSALMDFNSKHQKSVENIQGFNDKIRFNFVNRHFFFNNNDIFIGYGYEMEKEENARKLFDEGLGGDNAIGCNALAEVIFSITKEKIKKDEICSLTLSF
jgi:hypothetical protein